MAHRFDFRDEDGDYIGTFRIETPPTSAGTIDSMVLEAHQKMTDVLRQWLWSIDRHYQADLAKRSAPQ